METSEHDRSEMLMALTSDIVAAHVSNNRVSAGEVSSLITNVYSALAGLREEPTVDEPAPEPAVSVRSSVKKDHIFCLDCGRKMKMLRRHLSIEHGLSPQEYRDKWGLTTDYPLVAPEYAGRRRDLAVKNGLGRKPGQRRGRRKKGA